MRSFGTHLAAVGLLYASTLSSYVQASSWPRMEGPRRVECVEALAHAKQVFASGAFYLYEPQTLPWEVKSTHIIKPQGLDLSGGDALDADPQAFDKLRLKEQWGSLYWQKESQHGYRLAVHERGHGWRGDAYTLLAVDSNISPETVLAQLHDTSVLSTARVVEDGEWRPPEIFRLGKGGPVWVLTVGHPASFLEAWTVYVPGMDTLATACTIRFRPNAKRAVDLLPNPVRVLEAMLDKTIGSGAGEGTLQQTAGLRIAVAHTWANLALRPWARITPYNSRVTVDRGLEAWAGGEAANRKLLRAIQRQYPRAEQALASYYQTSFGKSPKAARSQASALLDAVFRSHYVFPGRDEEQAAQ
jgi:hypothetical protein